MFRVTRMAAAGAVAGVLALGGGAASAVTIDFGTQPGNFEPYVEDGFSFDLANLTNGQCPGEPSCLLQNNGANMMVTMTSTSGLPFNLEGFSYHFIGDTQQQGSTLTVSDTITRVFTQEEFGNDPFTITFDDEFLGVDLIKFTFAGNGTGRLDDINATVIPLPASALMLMSAIAGLGFIGRRRLAA